MAFKNHIEANGVEVPVVTGHSIFRLIYFFVSDGHRIQLACPDPEKEVMLARLDSMKWDMLEEW